MKVLELETYTFVYAKLQAHRRTFRAVMETVLTSFCGCMGPPIYSPVREKQQMSWRPLEKDETESKQMNKIKMFSLMISIDIQSVK